MIIDLLQLLAQSVKNCSQCDNTGYVKVQSPLPQSFLCWSLMYEIETFKMILNLILSLIVILNNCFVLGPIYIVQHQIAFPGKSEKKNQ